MPTQSVMFRLMPVLLLPIRSVDRTINWTSIVKLSVWTSARIV